MTTQEHIIELVRGVSREGDRFDRGERIILVDGVRWGRTVVTCHGCHGTKHVFHQEHGCVVTERPGTKYPGEIAVRSQKRQRWMGDKDDWQPTEVRVLAKVRELVEAGRLRHPDKVKVANERAAAKFRQHCADVEKERVAAFVARAREALQINSDEQSDVVDRVVAAMEWAQTQ